MHENNGYDSHILYYCGNTALANVQRSKVSSAHKFTELTTELKDRDDIPLLLDGKNLF